MKQTPRQLHLPLPKQRARALPSHQRRELSDALVELLIHATDESPRQRAQGGNDEPEADQ
ncbi:MAG: hypothetical protein F4Y47_22365 [Acidobacteriia bacterium]|nr:hypothetical protein [Terriglobia bacterium]MYG02544.1 hypothetical protein [Terriglobia bacterium]MYK08045.1 hypothetical protein [Terriglobia bacterium]